MAKKDQTSLRRMKSIFQVRYPTKLEYIVNVAPTMLKLRPDYPHFEMNGIQYTLRDPANRCSLLVTDDFFHWEQDAEDGDLERTRIERAVAVLPSPLAIEGTTRIGFRRQYLMPVAMAFETLVNVINVKFLVQSNELRRAMPPGIKDLMYRVDFSEDRTVFAVTLGPVTRKEIPRLSAPKPATCQTRNAMRCVARSSIPTRMWRSWSTLTTILRRQTLRRLRLR